MEKEKVIKGGIVPCFQLSENLLLHYYGDTIEVTNKNLQLIAIYKRVGWLNATK